MHIHLLNIKTPITNKKFTSLFASELKKKKTTKELLDSFKCVLSKEIDYFRNELNMWQRFIMKADSSQSNLLIVFNVQSYSNWANKNEMIELFH